MVDNDNFDENQGQDAQREPSAPEPPVRYEEPRTESYPEPQMSSRMPKQIVTANRFMLLAGIAGPLSLFIGGSLLSTVGLILAIIGWRKLNSYQVQDGEQEALASLRKTGKMALVVCAAALVINIVFLVVFYPALIEMLSEGDYSSLVGGGAATGITGGNSTWG